jgi:hypothetical protein
MNECNVGRNEHGWYIMNCKAGARWSYLHKDGTWHKMCGRENFHRTKEEAQALLDRVSGVTPDLTLLLL